MDLASMWRLLWRSLAVVAFAGAASVATERSVMADIIEQCQQQGEFEHQDRMYQCSRKSIPAIPPFPNKRIEPVPQGSAP